MSRGRRSAGPADLVVLAPQGFPGGLLPDISQPVVLLTESLQYPTVEFYDSGAQTSVISQPSGRQIDARDERLRQVSLADGLLWTSALPAIEVLRAAVGWQQPAAWSRTSRK